MKFKLISKLILVFVLFLVSITAVNAEVRARHNIIVQTVSIDSSNECQNELDFRVYIKNMGKVQERDASIERFNQELGIYEELNYIILASGRTTVQDMTIKLPKNYKSGRYIFTIRTAYNSIITDRTYEIINLKACEIAEPIVVELKELEQTKVLTVPTIKKGNKWFWPVFSILSAFIFLELVLFGLLQHKRNAYIKSYDWESAIEKQSKQFTEKDRLF